MTQHNHPSFPIDERILLVRGQKVMLDSDLAELYGVETKALKRAVRRNLLRFPEDFVFELSAEESENLRYQSGTSSLGSPRGRSKHGGRRYAPFVFTEQGVAMLSSVLTSKRAIMVNVEIMRTFVRLRRQLAANTALARKLDELERKYDGQFRVVFDALRELMKPPPKTGGPIGFV